MLACPHYVSAATHCVSAEDVADPIRLSDGPRLDLVWSSDPGDQSPPQVALEHLQNLVIQHLRGGGVTPERLQARIGGSVQTWRAKFAGTRRLTLEDLLALLMGQDATIADLQPLNPQTVKDLIPEAYWEWLSHTKLDHGLPWFRAPRPESVWTSIAQDIEEWWTSEAAAGREWAITPDVLVHRLVTVADTPALNAAAAVPDRLTDGDYALEWIATSTRVHVHWSHDLAEPLRPASVRDAVAGAAARLWDYSETPLATKILAVVGGRPVRETIADALSARALSNAPSWLSAGMSEAHRLGLERPVDDIQLQVLHRSTGANVDWYLIK